MIEVGCAIDHLDKTFVHSITHPEQLTLDEIHLNIHQAKAHLDDHNNLPKTHQTPSIIVSNIGMISGQFATPLIYPPATMMIAVGCLERKPVFHNGSIIGIDYLPLSFAFNHVLCTGGQAARFLKTLKMIFSGWDTQMTLLKQQWICSGLSGSSR